jgi:hypothetical protein
MALVAELVTKFTFIGNLSRLKGFNTGLAKGITLAAKAAAGITVATGAITTFVVKTMSGADAMAQLAKNTGVSIEKIQTLGYAASMSGSSQEALEGTLKSLSKTIGSAAQKGSADFSRLGISVRDANGNIKKADTILMEVGQSFKRLNLSMQEQQSFASALGIDDSLLQMLNKSSSEMAVLQARAKALGVISDAQAKKIINFNNSVKTLKFGMQSLARQAAIGLSPVIQNLSNKFIDFLSKNKFYEGIEKLAKGFEFVVDGAIRLIKFMDDLIDATITWKGAILVLGAVFAMTPIGKMVLLITGLLLIIDDLVVAFRGGKSVIRDFFKEFFGIDITPVLRNMVEWFKKAVKWLKDMEKEFHIFSSITVGVLSGLFVGKVASGMRSLVSVLGIIGKAFTMLMSPIGLFMLAIGVIAGLVFLIYKNWDKLMKNDSIRAFVDGLILWKDTIIEISGGVKDMVEGMFNFDFDKMKEGFFKVVDALAKYFREMLAPIVELVEKPINFIRDTFGNANALAYGQISDSGNAIGNAAADSLAGSAMAMGGIIPTAQIRNTTINQQNNTTIYAEDVKKATQASADANNQQLDYANSQDTKDQ